MPIKLQCPKCSVVVKAPDSLGGKQSRCPKCNQLIIVPDTTDVPLPGKLVLDEGTSPQPPVREQLAEPTPLDPELDEALYGNPYASSRVDHYEDTYIRQRARFPIGLTITGSIALLFGLILFLERTDIAAEFAADEIAEKVRKGKPLGEAFQAAREWKTIITTFSVLSMMGGVILLAIVFYKNNQPPTRTHY